MTWLEEILEAFEALGGASRYADLYEYISRTTDRELPVSWKSIIRRNIEEHSKDSLAFKYHNLFQKLGYGHWGLQDTAISEMELQRREKLSPQEIVKEVFVREHWRNKPSERSDINNLFDYARLAPVAAWCTSTHLEVELNTGAKLSSPIVLYPWLLNVPGQQRANFQLLPEGLRWPDVNEYIGIRDMLFGISKVPSKVVG